MSKIIYKSEHQTLELTIKSGVSDKLYQRIFLIKQPLIGRGTPSRQGGETTPPDERDGL